jgi:aspartate-semialdehyde dehydrogenase
MTPVARELRGHLESMAFPVRSLSLYDIGESEGTLTDFAGEATIVQRAEEPLVPASDLAFVCREDDPRSADYLAWSGGGGVVVDLAGVTRSRPEVPLVNCDVNPDSVGRASRVLSVPIPVAHPLSTLLHRLRLSFPLNSVSATVFRPASDFGERGVEELHQQTVSLLSFAPIPVETLGRQSAFDLYPVSFRGGADASLEERARLDVLRVLGGREFPLGVRIFQSPIFHGYGYSIHVDLEEAKEPSEIARALELEGVVRISRGDDGRSPAELAAESGIWISDVSAAPPKRGCFWIWSVCDAIRSGTALNAARLAGRLAEIAA